jgi:hypothetical protein
MPEFHLHHTPTHEQFFSSVLPVLQFIGIIGRRTGMQSFKASDLVTVRYRNGLPESAPHLDVLARNCPHLLPPYIADGLFSVSQILLYLQQKKRSLFCLSAEWSK